MKRGQVIVWLHVMLLVVGVGLAEANSVETTFFFDGYDLDLGVVDRDPNALIVICGGKSDNLWDILNAARESFPAFAPPVDFFFDYDFNARESEIVFNPILPAVEDESTAIAGMFVLWDTDYDSVSYERVDTLVFPEELTSVHLSTNDTLVLLLNTGEYLRVGNFSLDGQSLTFKDGTPTPEPSTWLLLSLGLFALLGTRYKKMRGRMNSLLLFAIVSMLVLSIPHATHAQGTKPLYRLYIGEAAGGCGSDSNCWSNHMDSGSTNVSGFTNQGRLGWVLNTQVAETKPLYQIYRSHDTSGRDIKDDHSTSDDLSEVTSGSINGGVLGYVYTRQIPGTIPLYRKYRQYRYTIWGGTTLWHTDHITTTNINEGSSDGWVYERVLGYILSTPELPPLCAFATGIPQSECEALTALYDDTNGDHWTTNTGWLQTNTPCNWFGVTCGGGRVTQLLLNDNQLNGGLSSEIGNLTSLQQLDLMNNQLTGTLPAALGSLSNLQYLGLSFNQLSGTIPTVLGNLAALQELHLSHNQLSGSIPSELGNLTSLTGLYLHNNQLSGEIPSSLGNLTQLKDLRLYLNRLSGNLPAEVGNLSQLEYAELHNNLLSGTIPSNWGNLANLTYLHLGSNQLSGLVPSEIGDLNKLQQLYLYNNQLRGSLPASLKNLTSLQEFTFFNTGLCEPVDDDFQAWVTTVPDVQSTEVDCSICDGVSEIPEAECEALVSLYEDTDGENWTDNTGWLQTSTPCNWYGVMCESGHVSQILMDSNQLVGNVPVELRNLSELIKLDLRNNQLSGNIPDWIGDLVNLQYLRFTMNKFTGSIPSEVGKLVNLYNFSTDHNQLTGHIPPEIGELTNLRDIYLDDNQLSGTIPPEFGNLTNLIILALQDNQLSGSVPEEIGFLTNLKGLGIGMNNLSGALPATLTNLTQLDHLRFNETLVCEPQDSDFQNWLAGVTTVLPGGIACASSDVCASVAEIPQSECEALVTLYNSTFGSDWLDKSNWGVTDTPCAVLDGGANANGWYGVTCESGHVTSLNLRENQLQGNIPTDIEDLSNLEALDLRINQLHGNIPPELGNLTNLEYLNLRENQLSGEIPPELGNLSQIREVWLKSNQLRGHIPPELGNLSNLQKLYLSDNQLSGVIPSNLGNLSNLTEFSAAHNGTLKGKIPATLGNLSSLQYLYLHGNQLEGNLPADLGNLSNLVELRVYDNPLRGSLPQNLVDITPLTQLQFNDTALCEPPEMQSWLDVITEPDERTGFTCQDYLNYEDWGGAWHDAEKVFDMTDSEMCWAAAASNILAWTGWGTSAFNSATEIFEQFKTFWTNEGGLPEYGWQWWVNGSVPPEDPNLSPATLENTDRESGNYWQAEDYARYFQENWAVNDLKYGEYLLSTIDELLHEGYGVVATTYSEAGGFGHSFTVWGYRYAQDGTITDLWVTDSDDSASELRLVRLELENYLWHLQDGAHEYRLKGIQAFQRNASVLGTEMTIRARASKGGAISPEGKVKVNQGDSQTFTITPEPGYTLAQLLVDHQDVSDYQKHDNGTYTYTFPNVQKDHSIEARFGMPITIKKVSLNENGEPDEENGGKAIITYNDDVCDYDCQEFTIEYIEGAAYLLRVSPDENSEFQGWYVVDENTGEKILLEDKVHHAKPDDVILAIIARSCGQ